MASYQEIETRLVGLEDKLKFVMDNMAFGQKSSITGQTVSRSLSDLYQEAKQVEAFNAGIRHRTDS